MTHDRFFKLSSFLKAVVDTDVTDRLREVKPVMNRVQRGCLQQASTRVVSTDEQMMPFTGACELRQLSTLP